MFRVAFNLGSRSHQTSTHEKDELIRSLVPIQVLCYLGRLEHDGTVTYRRSDR